MGKQQEAEKIIADFQNIRAWIKENRKKENFVVNMFKKSAKSIGVRNNREVRDIIMKYYYNIFRNVSSNSVLIWKDEGESYRDRESITAGAYGFGIRARSQAKSIASINDLGILKKHVAAVVKGLNARRKWLKAEELEKFFEIADPKEFKEEIVYKKKFTKPVKSIDFEEYSREGVVMLGLEEFIFEFSGEDSTCRVKGNNRHVRLGDASEKGYGLNEFPGILSNFLILDKVPGMIKEFEKQAKHIKTKQQALIDNLDKEFGKYLVINNL